MVLMIATTTAVVAATAEIAVIKIIVEEDRHTNIQKQLLVGVLRKSILKSFKKSTKRTPEVEFYLARFYAANLQLY